ncbi:MAG: CotH kinase family protein [Bacteroidota bacterium]
MRPAALLLVALAMGLATPASIAQGLVLNEFLASNATTLADLDLGEYSDWVELHNPTAETVDLSGYHLTDDLDEPTRWRFPDGTLLAPGGYLLVWTDGQETPAPEWIALHAPFRLSAGGEQIGLFSPTGVAVDTLTYGEQTTDISSGRFPDSTGPWSFFVTPTPGAANTTEPGAPLEPPTLSLASGFYSGTESITMEPPEPGVTIRYTLDGTAPTETSATYTEPIPLGQTSVIRAAAFAPERTASAPVTRSYFVGETSDLPVISLVTDPDGFFSDERGIYVEGTNGIPGRCRTVPVNWNQDWEREVHVSFFEPDGTGGFTLAIDQGAGVRIFGGCSRIYPQKSLQLHARARYGASAFEHRFFEELDIESFDDLVLRSSAQDWWRTMFRDGMIQTLTRHMDLDGQAYRPAIVFLNGEYWGIHNLREKLNEDWIEAHYGHANDEAELIEETWGGQSEHYDELEAILETTDLNTPQGFAEVKARMDVDQYLNYQIAQIYAANADWPGNNLKLWRPLTPEGRWRWMLFDTDFGYGGNGNGQSGSNTLALATEPNGPDWPNPPWSTFLFRRLLTNDGFRHTFIQRMAAHTSTTFDPTRTRALIDSLQTTLSAEVPRHKARWPRSISFGSSWDALVGIMESFAIARPSTMRGFVAGYFDEVDGSARLTLTTTAGGRVFAEGVPMVPLRLDGTPEAPTPEGRTFSPIFYRGVPIQLAAVPDEGYRFVGWSGLANTEADTLTVTLTESTALTATFAPLSTAGETEAPPVSTLWAVYPNPASERATIEATLATPGHLSVRVIDMLGREVAVLAEGAASAGMHALTLDVRPLPSGVYTVVMETEGIRAARRLVVTR